MNKFITLVLVSFAVGCGVSDSKLLSEIDASLWTKICDKATADPFADVECEGFTVSAQTSAECQTGGNALSALEGCDETFGTWKECAEWEPADRCDPGEVPAACVAIATCGADPASTAE